MNKFSFIWMWKNYSIKFNATACGMCTYAQLLPHFLLAILFSFNAITNVEISRMRWIQLIRLFPISEDLKIVLLISILRCWCKKERERIECYARNPMFLFVLSIYEFEYIYICICHRKIAVDGDDAFCLKREKWLRVSAVHTHTHHHSSIFHMNWVECM